MLLRCFFGIEIVTTFVLCGKQKPFGSAVAFILKLPRIICLSMEFQLLSVPVSHMDTRINGATENSGVYCGHQATSPTDTQTQTCMHVHAHAHTHTPGTHITPLEAEGIRTDRRECKRRERRQKYHQKTNTMKEGQVREGRKSNVRENDRIPRCKIKVEGKCQK